MIGIIGYGNIGRAISNGLLNKETKLLISDKKSLKDFENKNVTVSTNIEVFEQANVIFLCVVPEDFEEIAKTYSKKLKSDQIIVSLSPSHTLSDLKALFNHNGVVRYMPNTSIAINKGVSIISYDEISSLKSFDEFNNVMDKLGYVHKLDEQLINPTIGVTGSGIAIVFELLEAMGMGGILNGLPSELSYQLAAETLIGAGEMYLKKQEHPSALRDQVCSPGGITIKAVSKLEENNFKGTVLKAIKETI